MDNNKLKSNVINFCIKMGLVKTEFHRTLGECIYAQTLINEDILSRDEAVSQIVSTGWGESLYWSLRVPSTNLYDIAYQLLKKDGIVSPVVEANTCSAFWLLTSETIRKMMEV